MRRALLFATGLIGLLALGGWALPRRAWLPAPSLGLGGAIRATIRVDDVELSPLPDWAAPELREAILRAAGLDDKEIDLADPRLVERVGRAIEAIPGVRSVRAQKGPGRLRIHVIFRQPVLFVPWTELEAEGCYVDAEGVALPVARRADLLGATWAPPSLRDCFWADGIAQQSLMRAGERLTDERALAAARLAGLLQPHRRRFDLVAIAIEAAADGSPHARLRTARGSRIVWGAIDRDGVGASAAARLERLIDRARAHGSIDDPGGPYEWDLTSETSVPVPLTTPRRSAGG